MQQLARSLEIPPRNCFRIVPTLQSDGWIAETCIVDGGLSVGLLKFVEGLRLVQRLTEAARNPMNRLAQRPGSPCILSVRPGYSAETVLRAEASKDYAMSSGVGATYPLAVGSSGSVLFRSMSDAEIARMPDSE